MLNTCVDCGNDYEYDPNRPLGTSSSRCLKCRRKNTELNKKLILILLAGNGKAECRKCGYKRSVNALLLIDAVDYLEPANSLEEKKKRAQEAQFVLCLNCNAEVLANEVEMKVTQTQPVKVEFYSRKVTVVREKIEPAIEDHDPESIETEIVSEYAGGAATRVISTQKRIGGGGIIDVP